MSEDRLLVLVEADALPPRVRALLDPDIPRPPGSSFLVRRTHVGWVSGAWLTALLVIGIASLRATIVAGLDPTAGDERLIFGALAAVCLVGAAFAARTLLQGVVERSDVRSGRYRQGLHLLDRDGLLIAGRDRHTWVPRARLPAPLEISGPRSGSGHSASFAFVIVDDHERMERLDCGALTASALRIWAEHGRMPVGGGWV